MTRPRGGLAYHKVPSSGMRRRLWLSEILARNNQKCRAKYARDKQASRKNIPSRAQSHGAALERMRNTDARMASEPQSGGWSSDGAAQRRRRGDVLTRGAAGRRPRPAMRPGCRSLQCGMHRRELSLAAGSRACRGKTRIAAARGKK